MRKSIDGLAVLVQQKFKCLKEQNAFLRKNLFGRKSEKTKVVFNGQINLFDDAEQEAKKSASEPELQTVQEHTRKKKTGQRREMLEMPMQAMRKYRMSPDVFAGRMPEGVS